MDTFQAVSPGRRGRPRAPRPVVVQDACSEARNQLADWIQRVKREIDELELRGEYAEARKRLDTFAGLLRAKSYIEAPDAEGGGDDGPAGTDKLHLNPRRTRRAYERCVTFSERLETIYGELHRFIREGRVSDQDLLFALEMICREYDEKVENLSISWAEVQTAWRGNRDESDH